MIGNLFRAALFHGLLAAAAGIGATANAQTLALVGGKVYASPDAAPLDDAVVLTANGIIAAIGSRSDVQIPSDARVIDCTGKTVVAGFWNSHVHFTEAVWRNAGSAPAAPLTAHMQEMLTRWGFTTVWSLGSDPDNSMALRRRVYADEILGPNIFLVGSIFPRDGRPAYLPDARIPEAETPERAAEMARNYMRIGLDGIKLFTGAYKGEDKPVVNMEAAIAKAAVDVAHAQGKPVFAHPQNTAGIEAVIAAGVDVMAHTVGRQPGYSVEQLARFKQQGTALTPTLSLFAKLPLPPEIVGRLVDNIVGQLKSFSENGNTVLFGTDVGYIPLYDTTLEYQLMHRALWERQVLASLTTNPASYFKAAKKGRVEKGFDADIAGPRWRSARRRHQPRQESAYTIRAGKVIYQKP